MMNPGQPRIDAHHHLWRVDRGDYHWMPSAGPGAGPLREDYLSDRLAPHLYDNGVVGTVLVQAAQTVAETRFLLEIANVTPFVLGVTGWVPLDQVEAIATVQELAAAGPLVALRPMLHDIDDDEWITSPTVRSNIERLPAMGQRFEVLSFPAQLSAAYRVLSEVTELPVVIDHLSKPRYRWLEDDVWRTWMRRFAARPNTFCKLSGIVTEIGSNWTVEVAEPYARFVIDNFGPERVMFGSDWPVCRQVAEYDDVVRLAADLIDRIAPSSASAIWCDNALRFYGVNVPSINSSELST